MTDSPRQSVFDNRYRYDYIYPRGRSGETLRAWDTQDHDRPVVIKRPAPQDAPPLRAAQEVSIKAEHKALERLAGHPVVAELRGSGSFRVGGQSHEYIVVDRAEGAIVENMVLELAEQDDRLPLLEVLVIVDYLLDLLEAAHEAQVVYNDVDAKHLFWNREAYILKVIDWGNAVLLDEAGRQAGVTRQTDIYQVGELLYFILTGGSRLKAESRPDGEHLVNFGADMVNIPANLQAIITHATHPNTRRRYTTITELREELAGVRRPLEEQRDYHLGEIERSLHRPLSRDELETLADQVEEALAMDPGFPKARQLENNIDLQRKRLALQADIDAARIYLDNANWPRARHLMVDLLDQADRVIAPVIEFIIAVADLLTDQNYTESPPTLSPALDALLQGDAARAGQRLLAPVQGHPPTNMQYLMADRMSALIDDVVLLRPPLHRLLAELSALPDTDTLQHDVAYYLEVLDAAPEQAGLQALIAVYQNIGQSLAGLRPAIETLTRDHELAYDQLLDPLGRAETAAQAITQHLEVAGLNAYGNPGRAGDALRAAIAVDSLNPHLSALNGYFDEIHQAVKALDAFQPTTDGHDLTGWFERVTGQMQPYGDDLDDRVFHQALAALEKTARLWSQTQDALILGRRTAALENLGQMASFIEPFNQHIAAWCTKTTRQTQDATHVERLSTNAKLGQRLIEGYQLWDDGKFGQAAEFARQIADYAQTEGDRVALERLEKLGDLPHQWLTQHGGSDTNITAQAQMQALQLLLPDETAYHDQFISDVRQSEELYLKMVGRGLVEWMRNSSSTGIRALFLHYVWSGMLAAQRDDFEEAEFWREAALKARDNARTNPIFSEFDQYLTGRKLVLEVEHVLNHVQSPKDLANARQLVNQPMAEQWLGDIQEAVGQLGDGFTAWEDGDFQSARFACEEALRKLRRTQDNFRIEIGDFITWVEPLARAASELHQKRREIEKIANTARPSEDGAPGLPDPALSQDLRSIVEITEQALGTEAAYQVRQWLSTYESILDTHVDQNLSRNEKLITFDAHFNNLFIEKHPAFPLFEIWRRTAQNMPEPIEPISERIYHAEEEAELSPEVSLDEPEPVRETMPPRQARPIPAEEPEVDEEAWDAAPDDDAGVAFEDGRRDRPGIPWTAIVTLLFVAAGIGGFLIFIGFGEEDEPNNNRSSANTTNTVSGGQATTSAPTDISAGGDDTPVPTVVVTTEVPTPTQTPVPTTVVPSPTPTTGPTDTPEQLTDTPIPPTETATEAPPATEPPTLVSAPTQPPFNAPPQNLLDNLNRLSRDDYSWDPTWFGPAAGGAWQLGASKNTAGSGQLPVLLTPEFLEQVLGPQAAQRIISVEATMELTLFDANDIASGVFFGLGIQNASRQRSTAEIRIVQNDPVIVNWGINQSGNFQSATRLPQSEVKITLRATRQPNGTLGLFIDDQLLGFSTTNYADQALTPVLYTSGGGVYVVVTDLQIELAPIAGQ